MSKLRTDSGISLLLNIRYSKRTPMDGDSDSEFCLTSHIELSDINVSKSQSLDRNSHNDVIASLHLRHRILDGCFQNWRQIAKSTKKENYKELKVVQKLVRVKYLKYFRLWNEQMIMHQKLAIIGEKLKAARHFILWRKSVMAGYEERKKFMKVLLIRRSVYQHKFLIIWRQVLGLKLRYNSVAREADAVLSLRVVQALHIMIRKKRELQEQKSDVQSIMFFYKQKRFFKLWRTQLRYRILEKMVEARREDRLEYAAFIQWKKAKAGLDSRNRKVNIVERVTRKFALRSCFNIWFSKFYRTDSLRKGKQELSEFIRRRRLSTCLMTWISQFNISGYLSCCESDFLRKRRQIILNRCFGKWHSSYSVLEQRYALANECAEEFAQRKVSRAFLQWKSRFAVAAFDRTMMIRAGRVMRMFTVRRSLNLWISRFCAAREDKSMERTAVKFRVLSLQMKAFCSMKNYALEKVKEKRKEERAAEHYVLHLERASIMRWKRLHLKTVRRYVMITAVLKNWAHNVQLRQLQKWRDYNRFKKIQRQKMTEASEIYKQRCIRIALTGFVLAGQKIPFVADKNSEEEEEDLLVSNIMDDSIVVTNSPPKLRRVEPEGLSAPKRPSFLPVLERSAPPPPVPEPAKAAEKTFDPEAVYAELEQRFITLKSQLSVCDPSEKGELLKQFHDLIEQIAQLRTTMC